MFWLRNRQPKRWKEKTEGDVTVKVQAGTLTDEELDAKIAEKLAKKEKKRKTESPRGHEGNLEDILETRTINLEAC